MWVDLLPPALAMMAPRRKTSRTQLAGGGQADPPRLEEPKDYINELSHEVLCHIFRLVLALALVLWKPAVLCLPPTLFFFIPPP